MPYLILEYSNNIKEKASVQKLFLLCHQTLAEVASARLQDCKSRAIMLEDYFIGDGSPQNAYVFLKILLLEGRRPEALSKLGQQILQHLESHFSDSHKNFNLQVSLEIQEMSKSLYFRPV